MQASKIRKTTILKKQCWLFLARTKCNICIHFFFVLYFGHFYLKMSVSTFFLLNISFVSSVPSRWIRRRKKLNKNNNIGYMCLPYRIILREIVFPNQRRSFMQLDYTVSVSLINLPKDGFLEEKIFNIFFRPEDFVEVFN